MFPVWPVILPVLWADFLNGEAQGSGEQLAIWVRVGAHCVAVDFLGDQYRTSVSATSAPLIGAIFI